MPQGAIRVADSHGTVRLFGRSSELTHLRDALDLVATGRSRTVMVEGEAGIGKSRLVEELLVAALLAGFDVIAGRAEELERMRPFGAIADAIATAEPSGRQTSERARSLLALIRGGTANAHQLIDGLMDVVEERALATPLVLVIEDLHWADPSTITAVRSVQRRLGYLPILLVGTHRPHPEGPELTSFLDAASRDGATTIALQPLDGDAVGELASEILGCGIGSGIVGALEMAAGNPLYVTELLRGLLDQGSITVAGDIADADLDLLPATMRLTILRRLSFLPADTIELLRFAAVLGSSFGIDELAAVTGTRVSRVVVTLASAIASKVIRERGDHLSFRHDLIHEAIYQDIPAPVRATMHVEAAKALRSLSVPAPRVAEQLLRGVQIPTPGMIELITETAASLRKLAPRVAIELYERAVELLGEQAPAQIHRKMLMPLAAVGRASDAINLAEQLLATELDPRDEILVRLTRTEIMARDGWAGLCIPELQALVDDDRFPDMWRLSARVALANLYMRQGLAEAALAPAEQVCQLAREAGNHLTLAAGLSTHACALEFMGRPAEAVRSMEESLQLDTRYKGNIHIPHAQLMLFLYQADRFDDARRVAEEGHRRYQETGDISSMVPLASIGSFMRLLEGGFDEALAEAESALELIRVGIGSKTGMLVGCTTVAQVSLRRGDLEAASRAVLRAREEIQDKGGLVPWADTADWSDSLCREATGDPEGAAETAWQGWQTATMRYSVGWRLFAPDLVRLLLATGSGDRAMTVTEDADEGARRADGIPSAGAAALRCRGLVADDPELLLAALDLYRRGPRAFERALTCEDAAGSLARHDMKADARPLFEEALAFYEQVGTVRDAARLTAAMRSAGVRRGSRAPRRRPATGWAALTPSELEVARLAAEGLMNQQIADRLFISKWTVMTHLSHIFGKLGISSRTELAGITARKLHSG